MPRKPLTETEENEINQLKERGILVEIEERKLSPYVVVVACGDGHEYPDLFDHHRSCLCKNGGDVMVHNHLVNGGPLVLQKNSPLNHGLPGDELLIMQLGDSFSIKETHAMLLRLHAPCGAARLVGMGPSQQIFALREAVARLAETYPQTTIARVFDVRYRDNRQRSYFINF